MRIDIQNTNAKVSEEAISTIREKVKHLTHYYENIMDAIVYIKEETDQKIVEIKLVVKDKDLFIKEKAETLTAATDNAMDVCKKQLIKYKEKHQNILK